MEALNSLLGQLNKFVSSSLTCSMVQMNQFESEQFWQQLVVSPRQLAYLEVHFTNAAEPLSRSLLEAVDASHFSLGDWVEALLVISQWLEAHDLALSIEDQLAYTECACAAAGAGATLSDLPSLVLDLLQAYGCERAVKK